jgi:hypothetical protein
MKLYLFFLGYIKISSSANYSAASTRFFFRSSAPRRASTGFNYTSPRVRGEVDLRA